VLKFDNLHITYKPIYRLCYRATYDSLWEDNNWIHGKCRQRFYQTFTKVFFKFPRFFKFLTFLLISEHLLHMCFHLYTVSNNCNKTSRLNAEYIISRSCNITQSTQCILYDNVQRTLAAVVFIGSSEICHIGLPLYVNDVFTRRLSIE